MVKCDMLYKCWVILNRELGYLNEKTVLMEKDVINDYVTGLLN